MSTMIAIPQSRPYRQAPDIERDQAKIRQQFNVRFPGAITSAVLDVIFEQAATFPRALSAGHPGRIRPDQALVLTSLIADELPPRFSRGDLATVMDMSIAWVHAAIPHGRALLAARGCP